MPSVKFRDGRRAASIDVSADRTVTVSDSGLVLNQTADGKVTTLPDATSAMPGFRIAVRLAGVKSTNGPAGAVSNASQGHSISPHSSDKIVGYGQAGVTNKDMIMLAANMNVDDYVILVCNGVDSWYVQEASEGWTFEA